MILLNMKFNVYFLWSKLHNNLIFYILGSVSYKIIHQFMVHTKGSLKSKTLIMGFVAGFNIVSNGFIIPLYGAEGAAITTVASAIMLCGLYFELVRRRLQSNVLPMV